MEKTLVKFKTSLKNFQIKRKKVMAQCEKELPIVERIVNKDRTVFDEYTTERLAKELSLVKLFGHFNNILGTIITGKKKAKMEAFEQMKNIYHELSSFYQYLKQEHLITQSIINAFENDKVKDPINDISQLFAQFKHASLSAEEISVIIGMAISFNSQYAKRNKNHKIANIDMIDILATYYNPDGTFKFNENIMTFAFIINQLDGLCLNDTEMIYRLFNLQEIDICSKIIMLLEESNERLAKTKNNESHEGPGKETNTVDKETLNALQELKQYYKNGKIIEIPDDMDAFYTILSKCGLDEAEQKYIIGLIQNEINQKNANPKSNFLTKEQLVIYQQAGNLLDTLNHSCVDAEILRQYLEELQTILQMLETETNEEDIKYLLSDIPNIMEQLKLICERYAIKDDKSSNKFVFLENKNGSPYIFDDLNELEQSTKKAIHALFSKIDTYDKSQFRRVLSDQPLPYSMYEVINNRAHIAFIEIDAGIYLIIGADIPRSGYKEFNNRLKANLTVIKQLEKAIKNATSKNQILKANEPYAEALTEAKEDKANKLVRKTHN